MNVPISIFCLSKKTHHPAVKNEVASIFWGLINARASWCCDFAASCQRGPSSRGRVSRSQDSRLSLGIGKKVVECQGEGCCRARSNPINGNRKGGICRVPSTATIKSRNVKSAVVPNCETFVPRYALADPHRVAARALRQQCIVLSEKDLEFVTMATVQTRWPSASGSIDGSCEDLVSSFSSMTRPEKLYR